MLQANCFWSTHVPLVSLKMWSDSLPMWKYISGVLKVVEEEKKEKKTGWGRFWWHGKLAGRDYSTLMMELRGVVNFWASENLSRWVYFEGYSPRMASALKFKCPTLYFKWTIQLYCLLITSRASRTQHHFPWRCLLSALSNSHHLKVQCMFCFHNIQFDSKWFIHALKTLEKPTTWLWRWLPLRLSKRQSPTTVLFRTTITRTITQYEIQFDIKSRAQQYMPYVTA